MTQSLEAPFPLDKVKEAVIFKAMSGGFLQPLSTFFQKVKLSWGEAKTAYATLQAGVPLIVLGRRFFAEEVKTLSEAAEVVLHEIMHHVFRHLHDHDRLIKAGYSSQIQNLGEDAIINAFLHKAGCAGFMKRYYPDEGALAFLRPDSRDFAMPNESGKLVPLILLDEGKYDRFYRFYHDLYNLRASLEDVLDFFQRHFAQPSEDLKFLGGHGEGEGQSNSAEPTDGGGQSQPEQSTAAQGAGGGQDEGAGKGGGHDGPVILADVADKVLQAIGAKPVSTQARSNFAQVIRKITTFCQKPGAARTGTRLTRRMPVKLSRQDIISIERERDLFLRSEFKQREVTIFFDISGSVLPYLPFVVGLIQTLRQSEFTVKAVCWADRAEDVPFGQLRKGQVPSGLGFGTYGECVAEYIDKNKVKQAVVITDNVAGKITTKINGQIHLCLMEGSELQGSFLDKSVVAHCQVHPLKLGSN